MGNESTKEKAPDGIGKIVDDLEGQKPRVSEQVIQLDTESTTDPLKDKKGNLFDSALHRSDSDGTPKVNKDGTFARKPGKKPLKLLPEKDSIPAPDESTPNFKQSAMVVTRGFLGMNVMLFGDEFKDQAGEREQLELSFERYFESREIADVPPGMALVMCVVGYYGARLTMPKTKSKLAKLKDWLNKKIKRKAPETDGPQSDNRTDRKRENDISQTDSPQVTVK